MKPLMPQSYILVSFYHIVYNLPPLSLFKTNVFLCLFSMDLNVFADILFKKMPDSECNDPCDVNIEETCGAVWETEV